MQTLYHLILTDSELSDDRHSEDFSIGLFATQKTAEAVMARYLTTVAGFRDFPCTGRIVQKRLIGARDDSSPREVFLVSGWNINACGDEIDVIESDCFAQKSDAQQALQHLQQHTPREEWSLDAYRMDECGWEDGFCRV